MRVTLRLSLIGLWLTTAGVSSAANPSAEWITLGTAGGPIVHASQAQIANAVVVGDAIYLFDVGNGVLRQMSAARLPLRGIKAVFLSHHHLDHNADVGPI